MELYLTTAIPKKEDVLLSGLVAVAISWREVKNKDLRRIRKILNVFEECGIEAREKLAITFNYTGDKEIYEVPDEREWVRKLSDEVPHLFYFLSPVTETNIVFAACLGNVIVIKNQHLTRDELLEILMQGEQAPPINLLVKLDEATCLHIFKGIMDYTKKIGEKVENIRRILFNIPSLMETITELCKQGKLDFSIEEG